MNNENDPIVFQTKWGWTLIGPSTTDPEADTSMSAEVCLLDTQELSLQQEIRAMFRRDFTMSEHEIAPKEKVHPSAMDEYSLKQMQDSIVFDKELGHWQVALPFREGRFEAAKILGQVDSYANAKARLMKEKFKLFIENTSLIAI